MTLFDAKEFSESLLSDTTKKDEKLNPHKNPKHMGCVMKVKLLLAFDTSDGKEFKVCDILEQEYWTNSLQTTHWNLEDPHRFGYEEWLSTSISEEMYHRDIDDIMEIDLIPKDLPDYFFLEVIMDWDIQTGYDNGWDGSEYYEEHSWDVKGYSFVLDPELIKAYDELSKEVADNTMAILEP